MKYMQNVIRALLVQIALQPVHSDTLVVSAGNRVTALLTNTVTQREVVCVTQQL